MGDTRRRGRLDRHIEFLGNLYFIWALFNALVRPASRALPHRPFCSRARHQTRPGSEIAAGVTAGGLLTLAAGAAIWAGVHWWADARCGVTIERPAGRLALSMVIRSCCSARDRARRLCAVGATAGGRAAAVLIRETCIAE